MDRTLDDVISDRQRTGNRGGRARRQNNWGRDDSRKLNGRSDSTNIDTDWIHDKYEDDPQTRRPTRGPRNAPSARLDRYSPESEIPLVGKLRVDNLHYDLTEDDLDDLFTRIGPITTLSLRFDRAGRSSGTAYVTYTSITDARLAIREFDGANANGQPIRLTLLPTAPSADLIGIRGRGGTAPRNPFDTAIKPGRSLFDRIEDPSRSNGGSSARSRSRSPGAPRRTDTTKPAPEGVDRYIPGSAGPRRRSGTRSPVGGRRRTRTPIGRSNRSPGRQQRRGRGGDERRGGRDMVNGRPRKTQEDLDREMEDYWGKGEGEGNNGNGNMNGEVGVLRAGDDDIDMI